MRELGEPLTPQLRRLLWDHCQGYPWLLKKLCIHILDQKRNGLDQSEILVRTLRIEELFSKDIERLSEPELACIRQIASEAPAEFFKIVGIFGDVVITLLLDKRLIIRTGSRLNVYWDIFRDYLLTEKVPYIPTTYIPQINVVTYLAALRELIAARRMTYSKLAMSMNITEGTADNLVRDMVIVGHAEANRKTGSITALHDNVEDAAKSLSNFCHSHVLSRTIIDRFGTEGNFSLEDVIRIAGETYSRLKLSTEVLDQYAKRAVQWCVAAGVLDKVGQSYTSGQLTGAVSGLTTDGSKNRRGRGFFLGDATPENVLDAVRVMISNPDVKSVEKTKVGGKTLESLCALGIIDNRGFILADLRKDSESIVRGPAKTNPAIKAVRHLIE